jgi:hypothetical protein
MDENVSNRNDRIVLAVQVFGSFENWDHRFESRTTAITYKDVTKSFRTGLLERELQMVQLSKTRYSCITILWVS